MVKFVCEACQHLLGTDPKNLGLRIPCPHCGVLALVDPVVNDAPIDHVHAAVPLGAHAVTSTAVRPSTAMVSVRTNREPRLPVMRRTPGPLVRYCVNGFDKAIQMKVRWMVSAESAEAAQRQAEGNGLVVASIAPQHPMIAEEFPDEAVGRQQARSG